MQLERVTVFLSMDSEVDQALLVVRERRRDLISAEVSIARPEEAGAALR